MKIIRSISAGILAAMAAVSVAFADIAVEPHGEPMPDDYHPVVSYAVVGIITVILIIAVILIIRAVIKRRRR